MPKIFRDKIYYGWIIVFILIFVAMDLEGSRSSYNFLKFVKKDDPKLFNSFIQEHAKQYHIPVEELEVFLEKPWGRKQFLEGKMTAIKDEKKKKAETRRKSMTTDLMNIVKMFQLDPEIAGEKFMDTLRDALKDRSIDEDQYPRGYSHDRKIS